MYSTAKLFHTIHIQMSTLTIYTATLDGMIINWSLMHRVIDEEIGLDDP